MGTCLNCGKRIPRLRKRKCISCKQSKACKPPISVDSSIEISENAMSSLGQVEFGTNMHGDDSVVTIASCDLSDAVLENEIGNLQASSKSVNYCESF